MGGTEAAIIASVIMGGLSMAQSAQQAKHSRNLQHKQFAQQQQRAYAEQAEKERRSREKLRKTLAAQRARFGARGVSSGGGSAAALLAGMEAETARDIAADRRLLDMSNSHGRDLLEASNDDRQLGWQAVNQAVKTVSLLAEQ